MTVRLTESVIDGVHYGALISDCERYRYRLTRTWNTALPVAAWIMLNPSTADGLTDDPTVRRCMSFAHRWGMGGIRITNLFAWRATDPDKLPTGLEAISADAHAFPLNNRNDAITLAACTDAALVIAAWGAHKQAAARSSRVGGLLLERGITLHSLGFTRGRHPRHPLYVPGTCELDIYAEPKRAAT